jgi:hypothetical protein
MLTYLQTCTLEIPHESPAPYADDNDEGGQKTGGAVRQVSRAESSIQVVFQGNTVMQSAWIRATMTIWYKLHDRIA